MSVSTQIRSSKGHFGAALGFTLVELLVVVTICAILAALLLPAISNSKHKALQVRCIGNLLQLGMALRNFVDDNHAYPSILADTNNDNPGTWKRQLECGGFNVSKPTKFLFTAGVWRCPSARWPSTSWTSNVIPTCYGYNVYGSRGGPTNTLGLSGNFNPSSGSFASVTESQVVSPSQMMAIGDSLGGGVFFVRTRLELLDIKGRASSRHQGRANVVLCDGHVESPRLTFLFEDTGDAALVRWNRDHLPHRDKL